MSAASAARWPASSAISPKRAPASSFPIPSRCPILELYIPQREQTLRARVQWRRNDEIGLAFVGAERAAEAPPSAAEVVQRVAMLEAEITSLRALLKRLKAEKPERPDEAAGRPGAIHSGPSHSLHPA